MNIPTRIRQTSKPSKPAPALERTERARQYPAHTAESARSGVVILSQGERFIKKPGEGDAASASRSLGQRTCVRTSTGQTPRALQKLRVVDVEMVVHVII